MGKGKHLVFGRDIVGATAVTTNNRDISLGLKSS